MLACFFIFCRIHLFRNLQEASHNSPNLSKDFCVCAFFFVFALNVLKTKVSPLLEVVVIIYGGFFLNVRFTRNLWTAESDYSSETDCYYESVIALFHVLCKLLVFSFKTFLFFSQALIQCRVSYALINSDEFRIELFQRFESNGPSFILNNIDWKWWQFQWQKSSVSLKIFREN